MTTKKNPEVIYTHLYGLGGLIPGIIGLILAWGIPSPWSEYALMASGWLAAIIYAVIIWKITHHSNQYAKEHGELSAQKASLQEELARTKEAHRSEMESRAKTMEFLAGISMGKTPIPRTKSTEGRS